MSVEPIIVTTGYSASIQCQKRRNKIPVNGSGLSTQT